MSLFLMTSGWLAAETTTQFVSKSATWRYWDANTDPGNWAAPAFDDNAWPSGPGPLGAGDGHIATSVNIGPSNARYPTLLYRTTFTVGSAAAYQTLRLNLLRDDGAHVFLNGTEIVTDGAARPFSWSAWATQTVGGTDETTYFSHEVPATALVDGENVLAVASKQCNATSSDLGFDLELIGVSDVAVVLDAPAPDAIEVPLTATLQATATHPLGQQLTVSFFGREAPPAAPDFTIVGLPDTQYYTDAISGGTEAIFIAQTDWIRAQRDALNIVYVAHFGDVSNNGDLNSDEWIRATNALYRLDWALPGFPNGVPYGAAVGNHDQIAGSFPQTTTYYNEHFGIDYYQGRSYYGGHYGNNNNNQYQLFSASGLDFIVIYFEYDSSPDSAVLDWADALLKAHPTRRAIVVSHYILETSGAWGVQGAAIYNALKDNPNLFLMLCGHNHGESRRTDVYNGNTVHSLLADYQSYPNGGNGYLRVMTFSPSQNQVHVSTYSPWINVYETDSSSQFSLDYSMTTGPAFTPVQENTAVPSGTPTTANWSGLQPLTDYEWYATASDGVNVATSETRRFTTTVGDPPAAPTYLVAIAEASTRIRLTWSDNSATESAFEIEQSLGGTSFAWIGTVEANTTTALITGLAAQTTYSYRVRAVNGAGASDYSNEASATTLAPNKAPVANPQDVFTPEDTAVTITLTGSDLDLEDQLSFSIATPPAHGTLSSIDANNRVVYTPDLNYWNDPETCDSFTFVAYDGEDYSAPATVTITVNPLNDPPSAPATLTAEASSRLVTLSWSPATDVDGDPISYKVYRGIAPGTGAAIGEPTSALTYADATVANDVTYYYTVTAWDGSAESSNNPEVSATPAIVPVWVYASADDPLVTVGVATGDPSATSTPGDGQAQSLSEAGSAAGYQLIADYRLASDLGPAEIGSFTLYLAVQWSNADGLNDNLLVFVWNNTSSGWEEITPDIADGEFTAADPGDYVAVDGLIQVRFSDSAFFKKEKKDTLLVDYLAARLVAGQPDTTPPAAPTGLAATARDGMVTLNWTANTEPDLQSYRVYGSTVSGPDYTRIAEVPTSECLVTELANGTTYYFVVTAVDLAGNESLQSGEAVATPIDQPPIAPVNLQAFPGDGSVTLTWDRNPESDIVNYKIYGITSGEPDQLLATVPETQYTDAGLVNGTTYYYVVTAHDGLAEGLPSNEVSATPTTSAVSLMHVESITMDPLTSAGKNWKASGTVLVVDAADAPLAGATVSAAWYLNDLKNLLATSTATTDAAGLAVFASPPLKVTTGDTFILVITDVALAGYEYVPGITEASSAVP